VKLKHREPYGNSGDYSRDHDKKGPLFINFGVEPKGTGRKVRPENEKKGDSTGVITSKIMEGPKKRPAKSKGQTPTVKDAEREDDREKQEGLQKS